MAQAVPAAPAATRGSAAGRRVGAAMGAGSRWGVLVAVIFGVFVSILDTTIVNTAIPKIQAIFGADLRQAQYIATGYTLAQGVVVGASGFLANRYGIKRIYLLSLALFTGERPTHTFGATTEEEKVAMRIEFANSFSWTQGYVTCNACGHRWMAVRPVAATALECPCCHRMSDGTLGMSKRSGKKKVGDE